MRAVMRYGATVRILLTGGAGFIGGVTFAALLEAGHEVIVLDDLVDGPTPRPQKVATMHRHADHARASFIVGDVRDAVAMASRLGQLDAVVHLAALASVSASVRAAAAYASVNVAGTASVLELAALAGARRVVLASSSSVYGERASVCHETDPCVRPASPYGATKRAAELVAATWNATHEIPVTALRFFTVYGTGQRPDMVVGTFMRQIAKGLPVHPRAATARDFVHVDDVVRSVTLALEHDHKGFEIFNVGTGIATPLDQLARLIGIVIDRPAILGEPLPPWPGDVSFTAADTTRARDVLGLTPMVDLDAGLRAAWQWQARTLADRHDLI